MCRNPDYKITKTLKNGKIREQKVPHSVELTLPDGTVFPEKKNATDAKIIEILGLTADQFSQIVMIAQEILKLFVYKVGRAENDLFQIIQDGHLLEDPGKS